jgi:hypothetical protein
VEKCIHKEYIHGKYRHLAAFTVVLYGIAWSEIFIEPPPYAQQRRRRGERGTGVTKGS